MDISWPRKPRSTPINHRIRRLIMIEIDYMIRNKASFGASTVRGYAQWRESARIFWLGTHEAGRLVRGFFWWTYALVRALVGIVLTGSG